MAKRFFGRVRNVPYLSRVVQMGVALFGLSILIFIIARVVPGDPARLALGPQAPGWAVQQLREQLHLNLPIYLQYFTWLQDAFSGNLGISIVTYHNVMSDIVLYLPATIELLGVAAIIDIIFALLLGVLSGRYSNTWIDNAVRGFSYIGVSVPSFVFAIFFLLIFGLDLSILPTGGRLSASMTAPPTVTSFLTIDSLLAGRLDAFASAITHLIMPAAAIALSTIAQEARIIRSGIVENLHKDYITSETSHGIPERTIMFQYLLKPSIIPAVPVIGMDIASGVGIDFLVEVIFNWPGFGRYGVNAILRKDLNAVVGVVIVTGIIFAIMNVTTDIIVSYLDPRIRMLKRAE